MELCLEFPLSPKACPSCLRWEMSLLLPCLRLAGAAGSFGLLFFLFFFFLFINSLLGHEWSLPAVSAHACCSSAGRSPGVLGMRGARC